MEPHIAPGAVVVGVDGSETGEHALRWAVDQARLEDLPLALVHVVQPSGAAASFWMDSQGFDHAVALDAQRQAGERLLEDAGALIAAEAADLSVSRLQLVADPRQAFLDLSVDASTIVVGSRGRGPVKSLLLGSVSLEIARHARCPVFVVRPHGPHVARPAVGVGTDATPESRTTVEYAFTQAMLRALPLMVLHTFLSPPGDPLPRGTVDRGAPGMSERRRQLGESLAETARSFPDVEVELLLANGLPEEQLVHLSHSMQLVVVGHHHSTLLDEIGPGSAFVSVVEHADCAVAVVPG